MKKKIKMNKVIKILFLYTFCFALASCGEDGSEISPNESNSNDYGILTDGYFVATGSYEDVLYFSACVLSNSDQNSIKAASVPYKLGVVYSSTNEIPTSADIFCESGNASGPKYKTKLNNLIAGKKYYYRSCLIMNGNYYYAKDVRTFITPKLTPEIIGVTDITNTSAKISCSIDSKGLLGSNFKASVLISKDPNPTLQNGSFLINPSGIEGDAYTVLAQDLEPFTDYYYRAAIVANGGYYYSENIGSFTTCKLDLITEGVSDINAFTANIACSVNSEVLDGLDYSIGVQISNNSEFESNTIRFYEATSITEGKYKVAIEKLIANTEYFYRACLIVKKGYANSTYLSSIHKSFTTLGLGLEVSQASNVKAFTATLHGGFDASRFNDENYQIGFEVSSSNEFDNTSTKFYECSKRENGKIAMCFTNLQPNTKYYYRVCAKYNNNNYPSTTYKEVTTSDLELNIIDLTDISGFDATAKCSYNHNAVSNENYEVGILVSTNNTPNTDNSVFIKSGTTKEGTFISYIPSMTPGQTYYVRTVLKHKNVSYISSNTKYFKTKTISVKTGDAYDVKPARATIEGEIDLTELSEREYAVKLAYSVSPNEPTYSSNSGLVELAKTSTGKYIYTIKNLDGTTKYNYRLILTVPSNPYNSKDATVKTDNGIVYGNIKNFTTLETYPQGAVDLGLPSGIKWSSTNVGATKPESFGSYFFWGFTTTDYQSTGRSRLSTDQLISSGIIDSNYNLTPDYDAATQIMGNGWRIPTKDEFQELINKCQWTAATLNNVYGYKITGPNEFSIFLPKAGRQNAPSGHDAIGDWALYWTATSANYSVYYLFDKGLDARQDHLKYPIRPVKY